QFDASRPGAIGVKAEREQAVRSRNDPSDRLGFLPRVIELREILTASCQPREDSSLRRAVCGDWLLLRSFNQTSRLKRPAIILIEDRVGKHRDRLRRRLTFLRLAPQHGQRRSRRQVDELVLGDQRRRREGERERRREGGTGLSSPRLSASPPLRLSFSWYLCLRRGQCSERDVLQRPVGYDQKPFRAELSGHRPEYYPA